MSGHTNPERKGALLLIVGKDFFTGLSTPEIARNLLGKIVVHESIEGLTSGMIVETEAYLAEDDPASHSYRGRKKRNLPMFGEPGSAYIYISYGIHRCFNVVCQMPGTGEAVLIRGLHPLDGIELMQQRRQTKDKRRLTTGPGKLCQAMGIGMSLNAHPLQSPPLYILDGSEPGEVAQGPRIGITAGQELPLRFCVVGSPFLSRRV